MKLIKFKGKKETIERTADMIEIGQQTPDGEFINVPRISKEINIIKHYHEYLIPESEIKLLTKFRDFYVVNDIEVTEETFYDIIKQLGE